MECRKGGCLCGAVRCQIKGDPRAIVVCHCAHCQKQSGSAFSVNLIVKEIDCDQAGETSIYVDRGDSGQPVYHHFCGRCGSPMFARISAAPGKVVLKAGTLDSMDGVLPRAEIYAARVVKWLEPIAGATRFAQNAN